MESLVVANPISLFNLFGYGFIAGSLFAFAVMLSFEFIHRLAHSKK